MGPLLSDEHRLNSVCQPGGLRQLRLAVAQHMGTEAWLENHWGELALADAPSCAAFLLSEPVARS